MMAIMQNFNHKNSETKESEKERDRERQQKEYPKIASNGSLEWKDMRLYCNQFRYNQKYNAIH